MNTRNTHMLRIIPAVLMALALCACAVSRVDPMSIPLAYKTNPKSAIVLGGLPCSAISQIQVTDARAEKTLGTRVHESKPLKATVTAGTDPAAWAQDGVQTFLGQHGVTVQGTGPKLLVSLDAMNTVESIWHRSSYDAHLNLTGQLQSSSGKTCWKDSVDGASGNYGYSGGVPNYQETLNGALDAAIAKMAQSQGFKDAMCHCTN
ncbi:MAG TPA: hypothetical protein VIE42_06385 [Steroidobacteraceae bacterium]